MVSAMFSALPDRQSLATYIKAVPIHPNCIKNFSAEAVRAVREDVDRTVVGSTASWVEVCPVVGPSRPERRVQVVGIVLRRSWHDLACSEEREKSKARDFHGEKANEELVLKRYTEMIMTKVRVRKVRVLGTHGQTSSDFGPE